MLQLFAFFSKDLSFLCLQRAVPKLLLDSAASFA
jgi:hypothetical protein